MCVSHNHNKSAKLKCGDGPYKKKLHEGVVHIIKTLKYYKSMKRDALSFSS